MRRAILIAGVAMAQVSLITWAMEWGLNNPPSLPVGAAFVCGCALIGLMALKSNGEAP